MRPIVHADAESIDQFAAKPARDTAQRETDHFQNEQIRGRYDVDRISAHQPDQREDQDDDVGAPVEESDPLRSRAGGNCKPVDQTEHRCEQATDNAGRNVPVRDGGEGR